MQQRNITLDALKGQIGSTITVDEIKLSRYFTIPLNSLKEKASPTAYQTRVKLDDFVYDQNDLTFGAVVDKPLKTCADGSLYIGQWLGGERQGKGTRVVKGQIQEGYWRQDKLSGKGRVIYSNGNVYCGQLNHHKHEGKGILIWPDGRRYAGTFKQNQFDGYGSYILTDGSRYDGYWQDDKQHGEGTSTAIDGTVTVGQWHLGKKL